MKNGCLTQESFAQLMGLDPAQLPPACLAYLKEHNFNYRVLLDQERDAMIIKVLTRIEEDTQRVGVAERQEVWESGWQEIYDRFVQSGYQLETLRPQYIRPGRPLRYAGQYVVPEDPLMEYHFFWLIRRWMFETYLPPYDTIHEFGSGTGYNLAELAQLYPQKQLFGSDYVQPPLQILDRLREAHGMRIQSRLLDMTRPDEQYDLGENSALYTFGVLEQLAGRFQAILDFWLRKRPRLCINFEPVFELYDPEDLLDDLAIRFHQKRGYTRGFLPALRSLAKEGRIELLETRRTRFGSTMMEGYSLIVWRPCD